MASQNNIFFLAADDFTFKPFPAPPVTGTVILPFGAAQQTSMQPAATPAATAMPDIAASTAQGTAQPQQNVPTWSDEFPGAPLSNEPQPRPYQQQGATEAIREDASSEISLVGEAPSAAEPTISGPAESQSGVAPAESEGTTGTQPQHPPAPAKEGSYDALAILLGNDPAAAAAANAAAEAIGGELSQDALAVLLGDEDEDDVSEMFEEELDRELVRMEQQLGLQVMDMVADPAKSCTCASVALHL